MRVGLRKCPTLYRVWSVITYPSVSNSMIIINTFLKHNGNPTQWRWVDVLFAGYPYDQNHIKSFKETSKEIIRKLQTRIIKCGHFIPQHEASKPPRWRSPKYNLTLWNLCPAFVVSLRCLTKSAVIFKGCVYGVVLDCITYTTHYNIMRCTS